MCVCIRICVRRHSDTAQLPVLARRDEVLRVCVLVFWGTLDAFAADTPRSDTRRRLPVGALMRHVCICVCVWMCVQSIFIQMNRLCGTMRVMCVCMYVCVHVSLPFRWVCMRARGVCSLRRHAPTLRRRGICSHRRWLCVCARVCVCVSARRSFALFTQPKHSTPHHTTHV